MSLYRRTYRLECESANIGAIKDLTTGTNPSPRRGEDSEFLIALFSGGAMIPRANISSVTAKIVDSAGAALVEWTNAGAALNGSLTVGAWRRGSDHLASFILNATDSTALAAGAYRLVVTAALVSVPSGSSGTVVFANAAFDLVNPPAGTLPSSPPTPGPATSYTKAESDAKYALLITATNLTALDTAHTETRAFVDYGAGGTPKFIRAGMAMSLSDAEKAQARSNILALADVGSTSATLAGGATHTPTPAAFNRFVLSLTGNATLANATTFADWRTGRTYEILIIQDATGGRILTWGSSYIFPTGAAVNPLPSAISRFFAQSDGTNIRITEAEPTEAPSPDILVSASRGTTIDSTPNITGWTERASGVTITRTGTIQFFSMNGRPAAAFTGSQQLNFATQRVAWATGGCAVAIAFDSRAGGSPQFLVRSSGCGVAVAYNSASGLYLAGLGADSGNRVALPFTPNESTVKIFIASMRGSLNGGGGMALDQSGAITYNSSGAQNTGAIGTEYFGANNGAEFWNGRIAQVQMFQRALTWPEMIALRRGLTAEYNG